MVGYRLWNYMLKLFTGLGAQLYSLFIICFIYVSLRKVALLQARVSLLNCSEACLLFSLYIYNRKEKVVEK